MVNKLVPEYPQLKERQQIFFFTLPLKLKETENTHMYQDVCDGRGRREEGGRRAR